MLCGKDSSLPFKGMSSLERHRAARQPGVISASYVKSAFSFWQELPKFQELIFEDFDNFILVENTYEEVVLQSVMKDIMQGERTACILLGGEREALHAQSYTILGRAL